MKTCWFLESLIKIETVHESANENIHLKLILYRCYHYVNACVHVTKT